MSTSFAAFFDELSKIAAARLHGKGVLSSRKGRRPITAMNLLRKEREGRLSKFQHAKEAATGGDSAGQPDDVSGGWADEGAARPPKMPAELPPETKSTTMSTKEGSALDKARGLVAGGMKRVQEGAAHAAEAGAAAAKGHIREGAEEVASALKPHMTELADHLIDAGQKAQVASAPHVGREAGRAAVEHVKGEAKKVWDSHKGKIIGGTAAAYAGNKAVDYGLARHREKHAAFLDELSKIAQVPGAMGSVNPFNTGENPMASPETRQHPSLGDIPTQDQSSNIPSRTESAGPQISTATGVAEKQYVPGRGQAQRRGDVPGMPKDPNAVDRLDARDSATTVTGLAQNSNNIGAIGDHAEHVG